jgi:hypothetical protein
MPERIAEIRSERIELLNPASVLDDFRDRAGRDVTVRLLSDEAQRRGGRFDNVATNVLGYRHSFEAAHPFRPRPGERGGEVNSTEFEIQLQQYPSDTTDELAIGIATVRGGNSSASYPVLLEAPNGDFLAANEYTVVGDRIVPTDSWWTAVTGCLTRQCVTVCANSLATCITTSGGTWVAYLGCVAWNCGGCWVKCAGCATCNCSWWCRWAVGCCSQ